MYKSKQFLHAISSMTRARRRLYYYESFMLKAIVFVYIINSLVSTKPCSEETVPVSVNRRPSGDIFVSESNISCTCNEDDNLTYLVAERQCVDNQDLLNGKYSSA